MLTGWQNKNGATYYLLDSGAMYSGWIRAGNAWYYLNKPEDGGTEGAMRTGWLVTGGQTYYLKPDGIMAEGWYQADGNWYYFYPIPFMWMPTACGKNSFGTGGKT